MCKIIVLVFMLLVRHIWVNKTASLNKAIRILGTIAVKQVTLTSRKTPQSHISQQIYGVLSDTVTETGTFTFIAENDYDSDKTESKQNLYLA